MTEETPVVPGWVEGRLDAIFAELPETTRQARDVYLTCLARQKAPAAPSDLLGAEFKNCRSALRQSLLGDGIDHPTLDRLDAELEVLEAEYTAES